MLLSKFPHYDHKQHIKESIINCLSEIEILDINSSTHICKIDTHQSWSKAPIFAFGTNFEEALNESLILEKLNLKCNHFRNNIKLGLKLSNVGKWTAKCLFSCPSTLAVDPITTAIQPSKRTFEQCVFFLRWSILCRKGFNFHLQFHFSPPLILEGHTASLYTLYDLWRVILHCNFAASRTEL